MWKGVRKAINNNTKSSNQSEKKAFTTFTSVWGVFDEKVKDRFAWVDHHNERDAGLLAHQQLCVLLCGIQARDQVLQRASTSRRYYAQSSSCFVIGLWSRPSPYDKRLFIRFETVGVNTFDWKRNSFLLFNPLMTWPLAALIWFTLLSTLDT